MSSTTAEDASPIEAKESLDTPNRPFQLEEMYKALSNEHWTAWDWTKLTIFSNIKALVTGINNRLEMSTTSLVEQEGLRCARDVARGFENCVQTVFDKLDKELLVELMRKSPSIEATVSSRLFQEETWQDIIDHFHHRVDRLETKIIQSGMYALPLPLRNLAVGPGIPEGIPRLSEGLSSCL